MCCTRFGEEPDPPSASACAILASEWSPKLEDKAVHSMYDLHVFFHVVLGRAGEAPGGCGSAFFKCIFTAFMVCRP